jgi:hypothetical protein
MAFAGTTDDQHSDSMPTALLLLFVAVAAGVPLPGEAAACLRLFFAALSAAVLAVLAFLLLGWVLCRPGAPSAAAAARGSCC